ncbi:MAG: NAD(P)(+) transhydrogenase (Re/Si-specific) subunit beta, partial [Hyphomicrobiales bacterium]|nr:NAD(P)(+) transhydrogenase (Re/Si-specific) subunit beta [Hyphomicrobiales bacterium]
MSGNLAASLYVLAAILFILALRGLSSPESSRTGNVLGIVGMVVAMGTTLFLLQDDSALTWGGILLAVVIGGGIGAVIARKIAMTAMPQLVAAFHSLVG